MTTGRRFFITIIRFVLKPIFAILYGRHLPHFSSDFKGERAYMLSELKGGEARWSGTRRRRAHLGNTHPWNRYFNRHLATRPQTLAEIETFLIGCRYRSDRETRSQRDFWEPPDIFEKRKAGDCEDHAIWAWRQLHDLGYKARLVLGYCKGRAHAWVLIFANGRAYLMEPTLKYRWFPKSKAYEALWSVERREKKRFVFFDHFTTVGGETEPPEIDMDKVVGEGGRPLPPPRTQRRKEGAT